MPVLWLSLALLGCGLNVLNDPPIASLSQLLPRDAHQPLGMERTAAAIMAKFEGMWYTFLSHRGSFDPFMDLYLERWLHSQVYFLSNFVHRTQPLFLFRFSRDQLVTLTTVVPSRIVRIVGITSDHGLLRTVPERTGWAGDEGFIDLQPDGNSFDLMAGMIKTKT